MDLREARIREQRAALVRAPDRGGVRALRVRRKIEHVAVAARRQTHRIGDVRLDLSGDQIAGDDAARFAVDHDQVEHLGAREHLDFARADLPLQRLIGAEQQAAAPSGRARRTCATPARRRTIGSQAVPPYSRANGTPCATHWSMMLTLICASR